MEKLYWAEPNKAHVKSVLMTMAALPLSLSIVAPAFNEAETIEAFVLRAMAAASSACGSRYELILVDDGSQDATWEKISALSDRHEQIVGVRLLKNHGHQLAATAGLAASRGQRVLLIDADLQDPPELLLMMMPLMDQGADVVYGQRLKRAGESWFKLVTASAFYRLLGRLATISIPQDTGDFRLMSRRVVDILLAMPERDRFIRGMVSWIGGRQVALPYERDARFAGKTKYTLGKMTGFALDAITGFSSAPLRLATGLGLGFAVLALFLLVFTLISWFSGHTVAGWASIMAAITVFSSAQLLCIGIIGEYLGRLVQENKQRPIYLIESLRHEGKTIALDHEFCTLPAKERQLKLSMLYGATTDEGNQRLAG